MLDTHRTHPVLACVRGVQAALEDVAGLDPAYMPTDDKAAALLALTRALASASALHARLLAASEDVAADLGARDVAAWLAPQVHADYRAMRKELELGRSLESAPLVAAAYAEGRISAEHVRIALNALDTLATDVSAPLRDQAEAALVEHAAELAPKAFARVARHLEAVLDPDGTEAAEGRALLREERSAWEKTTLRITPQFDGTHRISGLLPESLAHRLRTYVEAFAQPRKLEGEIVRSDQRFGRAFCDLVEHMDPSALPDHGGDATAVLVTLPLASLRDEFGAAALGGLDSETRISAGEARRLACTAGIIPAVLGSRSQILDLGRTKRLFSPAQRKALRTRHSTCQVEGCDVPSTWCDAHHEDPWSRGGRSDLKNAVLVCGHHHRRLHDPRYLASRSGSRIQLQLRR